MKPGRDLHPTRKLIAGHLPIVKNRLVCIRTDQGGQSKGGRAYNITGSGRVFVPRGVALHDADPGKPFQAITTPGYIVRIELAGDGVAGDPVAVHQNTGTVNPVPNGDAGSSFWVGVMLEDGLAGEAVNVLYQPSPPVFIGDDAPLEP